MTAPESVATRLLSEVYPRLLPFSGASRDEFRSMLAQLRRAQKDTPREQLADLFITIGQIHYFLREFKDARDAFSNATIYDKLSALAWNNLASALHELQRLDESKKALEHASSLKAKSHLEAIAIAFTRVELLCHRGDAEARGAFRSTVATIDPNDPSEVLHASVAAAFMGRDDDAVEFLARAISVASGDALSETPAIEFVLAHPDHLEDVRVRLLVVAQVVDRVAAAWASSPPQEHSIDARLVLNPAALAAVAELSDAPPPPTDAMRRLLDESHV